MIKTSLISEMEIAVRRQSCYHSRENAVKETQAINNLINYVKGLEAENDKLLASSLVEAAGIHEDQIKQLKLKISKQRAEISMLRGWIRDLKTPEQAGEN